MNKTKLIVDFSSVVGAYMHIRDEEFGVDIEYKGQTFHIPDTQTSLERFQHTVSNLEIGPIDFIAVKDPGGLPKVRTRILKNYKQKPRISPPEFGEARTALFDAATAWLKSEGAIIATPKNGTEADDLVNQLATRLPKTVIWSRDKDMLACPTDVLHTDKTGTEFNPEKFPVPDKYIHVYRTIVLGDDSDNVGSCKGFGPKAWDKMMAFDPDSMADLDYMLANKELHHLEDHVENFKPFQLILDQAEDLYKIYKVLSFFPVPAAQVKWEGGVAKGNSTLVTADNYEACFTKIKNSKYDYAVQDYEADTCDESREWCRTSGVKVDVLGQEITGMGLRLNTDNYYFSVDHADTNNITIDQLEDVLEHLWGVKMWCHNASFEQSLTHTHFGTMLPNVSDTMLMGVYVDEDDSQALKHLSSKWLEYKQASYMDTLDGRAGMRDVSGKEVVGYGIDDVITTDGLMRLFTVILQYEKTLDVFHTVEDDALYYTTLCFIHGVDFDEDAYRELKRTNDNNIYEGWNKLSDALLDLNWVGGEFREVKNLNIGEVNRVYKAIHGADLPEVTSAKMAIKMMDDRELAQMMDDKDFERINKYYLEHWKPVAEFSVRSPKQMGDLLYEVLKCPVRIRNKATEPMRKAGKQGNPASNEAAIMNAIAFKDTEHVELLQLLVEYKGYLTKESLFLEKWPRYVSWKDGKIHSSQRQSNTTTKRPTSSAPNLLQLPKKQGKEFRNMMKARKGYTMVALDFKGQELCLGADDSRDPAFLSCYIGDNKRDPHSLTGLTIAQKFQVPNLDEGGEEQLDLNDKVIMMHPHGDLDYQTFIDLLDALDTEIKDFRTLGKKINFTATYGAMAKKVAQTLCITEKEAQVYLTSREETFPGLIIRIKEWHKICKKRQYATTMMGGRRHLDGHKYYGSRKEFEQQAADRLAYSMRIQGSAAEMTKLATGRMYSAGLFDNEDVLPIANIYDECVLQIRDELVDEKMPILIEIMTRQYADMIVPMQTDPEVGKNFGSLKKWEAVR